MIDDDDRAYEAWVDADAQGTAWSYADAWDLGDGADSSAPPFQGEPVPLSALAIEAMRHDDYLTFRAALALVGGA